MSISPFDLILKRKDENLMYVKRNFSSLKEGSKEAVENPTHQTSSSQHKQKAIKKRAPKRERESIDPTYRRVTRQRKNPVQPSEEQTVSDNQLITSTSVTEKKKIENVFGSVPDVSIGTTYETRLDCSHALVHRPTVAGIHGNETLGCYSIALSGGYEDDVDDGETFIYTGAGGRDLKGTKAKPKNLRTAAQSKDQELTKSNKALSLNVENKLPVRVVRGYKLGSKYAPPTGYRYDGLYNVEKYWSETGKSGFLVYKFLLKRCPDQEPPPWAIEE